MMHALSFAAMRLALCAGAALPTWTRPRWLRSELNVLGMLLVFAALLGGTALAATLTAQIQSGVIVNYRGTNDLGTPTFSLNPALQPEIRLTTGTSANQADLMFSDTRTVALSSSENLDLAGVLTDPLGTTLTFVTIKMVKVCAASGNTNNVLVGGAASNTFLGMFDDATDIIRVKPGGCFLWVAPATGAAVTAATGDILKVANSSSGTSVTYSVIIIGTSA